MEEFVSGCHNHKIRKILHSPVTIICPYKYNRNKFKFFVDAQRNFSKSYQKAVIIYPINRKYGIGALLHGLKAVICGNN